MHKKKWIYKEGMNRRGPFTDEELKNLLKSESISPDTPVWNNHLPNWIPAKDVFSDDELEGPITDNAAKLLPTDYWFYIHEDRQRGPISKSELRQLLDQKAVPDDVMVWRKGMMAWRRASEMAELIDGNLVLMFTEFDVFKGTIAGTQFRTMLREYRSVQSPELSIPVQPWIRLVARSIDFIAFSYLIVILLDVFYEPAIEWNSILMTGLTVTLFSVVEAFCLSQWGATPGKALLRVSVQAVSAPKLTYTHALRRSLSVLATGIGFKIPFVSQVLGSLAYHHLTHTGTTVWDYREKTQVVHRVIGRSRAVVACLLILGYVILTLRIN